jgi:hypothetical protein
MTHEPLQLNCPECPRRMEFLYRTVDGQVMVYRCVVHGEWHLGPDSLHAAGEVALEQEDLTTTG